MNSFKYQKDDKQYETEFVKHPFNPVYDKNSKILILGSFPPPSSEKYGFYYGHKNNNFWKNLAEILKSEILHDTPEAKREFLYKHKIALWDIIKSCVKKRGSSSDSDIILSSITPNDIPSLLQKAPNIKAIITTGNLASKIYKKHYEGFLRENCPLHICICSSSKRNQKRNFKDELEQTLKIITKSVKSYI